MACSLIKDNDIRLLIIILAIARRCFCPPESLIPRSPTLVSYFRGRLSIKSEMFASLAAFLTLAKFCLAEPYAILYSIVLLKSTASVAQLQKPRRVLF